MKSVFIKLVTGNNPRIKVALTVAVSWVVSYLITRFGLQLGEDSRTEISNYISGTLYIILEAAAAKMSTDGVKSLQTINPDPTVKPDGYVGLVTVASAKLMANEIAGAKIQPLSSAERKAHVQALDDLPSNVSNV